MQKSIFYVEMQVEVPDALQVMSVGKIEETSKSLFSSNQFCFSLSLVRITDTQGRKSPIALVSDQDVFLLVSIAMVGQCYPAFD